jgi:hypothetical protein
MRSFIKFCGGLFVVTGFVGFVVAGLLLFAAFGPGGGIATGAAVTFAFGAAGVVLVGGTAYMLCEIDARLERMSGELKPSSVAASEQPT